MKNIKVENLLKVENLSKKVNVLLDEGNELNAEAEKHLSNGNELEWEESKLQSVEKIAYARGIRYTLEELNLVSKIQ